MRRIWDPGYVYTPWTPERRQRASEAARRRLAGHAAAPKRTPPAKKERAPPLRQTRILAGLCPDCGEDAAPYLLCSKCRQLQSLGRLLNRAHKHGLLLKSKSGASNAWSIAPGAKGKWGDVLGTRPLPSWGEGREDDRRMQPRVRGVRIDVEQTLVDLLRAMGRPATIEEIQAAWGRLRGIRKHGSLAGDIQALIEAERRRCERAAKRAGQNKAGAPLQTA